ncbi:acetyltransferase, GNAT family [Actinosynnema pretiosum subsp. pretiosum]|nr:acetyltransferase, GNAT family [Actinosynnema pretiosum subsp. pretiosum]
MPDGPDDRSPAPEPVTADLLNHPEGMSVRLAYVDGEPVSRGRVHYRPGGAVAELAGGRTKPAFRGRGLFTAVVASRLHEARSRGRRLATVDALPTSEPILTALGFRAITWTRPYSLGCSGRSPG